MSRNFASEVDTQREYFNCQYFNQSGDNQIARYETTLLKPFFNDPDKWKLAINRASVPLSMPLTHNNIPLNQWEVGIQYTGNASVNQTSYQLPVPQFNEKIINPPQYYNMLTFNLLTEQTSIIRTQYNDLSNQITTVPTVIPTILTAYDTKAGTSGSIYCSSVNAVQIYNAITGLLTTTINMPENIISICADSVNGDFYVYTISNIATYTYRKYTRTNATTWTAGITWQFTNPLYEYVYMTYANNTIVATDSNSNVVWFNSTTGSLVGSLVVDGAYSISATANYVYILRNAIGRLDAYEVGTSNTLTYRYFIATPQSAINIYALGLSYEGNLVVLQGQSNSKNILNYYGLTTGNLIQTVLTPNVNLLPSFIFPSVATQTITVDSGSYDIFSLQQYLNQINLAFQKVFNYLKQHLSSTFLPTEPPSIIFEPATKLFSLNVEGQYTTTNQDGTNQYQVYLNQQLWNKFSFPSESLVLNPGSAQAETVQSIILQNYGINAVQGNGSPSLPQFILITQPQSTIYAFNDLTRIIFATTQIPVSGDGDGTVYTNTGTTNNKSINMITDIAPDTTVLSPGTRLIYVPAGILRWYNLYAQQPFSKIDIQVYYEMKDGQIYQLAIQNNEYFSVKLEFKKGLGDF